MNEDRRRTVLLLGAIAGAAGLVIGALLLSRRRNQVDEMVEDRSVADVLSDCYSKVREIQSHLTELAPVLGSPLPETA